MPPNTRGLAPCCISAKAWLSCPMPVTGNMLEICTGQCTLVVFAGFIWIYSALFLAARFLRLTSLNTKNSKGNIARVTTIGVRAQVKAVAFMAMKFARSSSPVNW